ncbi:myb family transcription factor EFM-like isoform X1 [Juglans microcarpa x Juglans regia]|uniref:myb family transcription factor EFM-like isoform X1 n=1 Tax=Juglans microcarpa x Juglans regia TaxID=2249226 RepID=UPI001B7E47C7|nr:myb family transcription factor EFM-like isoform X1 [Juglans microcarpa x Juglans regia]
MASPSELSLDCKPHSYSMLLKSFGDQIDQTQKIEDFLSRLEEERLKIDAFKRELPLCMQLLTNAVEAHRQQLQAYRGNQGPRPVLEEFIPLKQSTSESSEKSSNNSDKANWMTSAQLWSQASDGTKSQSAINISPKEPDIGFSVSPKLAFDGKQRNGGAFHPFSKERNSCPSPTLRDLPDLALASADQKELEDKKCLETENGISCPRRDQNIIGKGSNGGVVVEQGKGPGGNSSDGQTTATTTAPNTSQSHRKARRCWSPDLHRRFVNALQMLGGSQVATPKQIRELMKVDGLTNDEVKSHLQKYRLHTRRPSPSPQASGAPAPQLVVLGGIWVPPEYATAAAAHTGASALYGTHPGSHAPSHYCGPAVPQEFYAAPPPPHPPHHQLHHHALHHQVHVYKATPQTNSSPESDIRGTGDRSESIEDGKSESSSWNKGESGENGGERKGFAAMREDGEESNGSGIILKF